MAVGPFVLVTHPETRIACAEDGNRATILIGDAFFTVEPLDRAPLDVLVAADDSPIYRTSSTS